MTYKKRRRDDFTPLHTNDEITAPLWIQFRNDPALSIYPLHGHAWAEFIYAFNGVMEISIENTHYITPPPYGIWLPPHKTHSGLNRTYVSHGTLYVHESLCADLPSEAGILLTTPLVSALMQHLKDHPMDDLEAEHLRLLHVLLDQLRHAPLVGSYLPNTKHPILSQVLDYLHEYPSNNSSLAELAKHANVTERTLSRYSQQELSMSLNEWRQRLKVMKAMSMLNEGKTVENIALDLGYASSSAFIHMFKRWMHMTPDQFRRLVQPN